MDSLRAAIYQCRGYCACRPVSATQIIASAILILSNVSLPGFVRWQGCGVYSFLTPVIKLNIFLSVKKFNGIVWTQRPQLRWKPGERRCREESAYTKTNAGEMFTGACIKGHLFPGGPMGSCYFSLPTWSL
jgi:hypothetical protein